MTSTGRPTSPSPSSPARSASTWPSGEDVDGYTLNGTSPGPTLRVPQGSLLEVRLVNESIAGGTTLHWHGVAVPNADDGVAGVTQDAVPVGGTHVYRFRPPQAGTYWYHAHQLSHEQVERGLLGALVVDPPGAAVDETTDVVALTHLYGGRRTVAGRTGDVAVPAAPGTPVRVRVINTDNGPMRTWVDGAPFRVLAVDGTDVHEPAPVSRHVGATSPRAGGWTSRSSRRRAVTIGGSSALVVGASPPPASRQPETVLDLLHYGTPAPLGFDPATAARSFEYAIGRRPGFLDGRPGLWWTVNGHLFPDVPMFMVAEGDVVRMHITNTSGEVHPMHLHGHQLWCWRATGCPRPAARGGSTRWTSATARATTSRSSPTTRASGGPLPQPACMPRTGWSRT